MPQEDPSRTETATPKQRNKQRDKGNVPKSQELPKAVIILMALCVLWLYMGYLAKDLMDTFHWFFTESMAFDPNEQNVYDLLVQSAARMAYMVLPVMFFLGLAAYTVQRLQVGALWTTQVFKPKLKIFNLVNGLKRIFISLQMVINLLKNIAMATAIAVAVYMLLRGEMENMLPLFYYTPTQLAVYMLQTASMLVLYVLVPLIVIAAADTIYTRWDYEEKIKMTKDEVKDERKQAEGDPQIKSAQRQKVMEFMAKRMLADVPKADVVVTNPTHYAVAIQYDPTKAPAPLVLAKGVDAMAERIKEVAREHNVPIKENVTLARALYASVEIGDIIPEELYQAVASILAQLSKFKRNRPS